jgi:hypothetical protein
MRVRERKSDEKCRKYHAKLKKILHEKNEENLSCKKMHAKVKRILHAKMR